MGEVFDRRSSRIEAQYPSRRELIDEHRQVCAAIARMCRQPASPG
jgi:hypothetical protein